MSTVTSDGPETRRDIYNKSAVNRRVGVWVVLGRLGKSIVVAAKGIEEEKRCSRAMIVTSRPSLRTQIHLSHAPRVLTVRYSWLGRRRRRHPSVRGTPSGWCSGVVRVSLRRRRNNMCRGGGAS